MIKEKITELETKSLESGALVVFATTLIGSILGIVKNILLASQFGASIFLDIYFAAFRIPDFFYNIFVFGALSSAFFPVFSETILKGKEETFKLFSFISVIFISLIIILSLVVLIFNDQIAYLIAPGFSKEALKELATIIPILMLQPLFLSLANLTANFLQLYKRFFISTFAQIFYNLGIILGIIFLTNSLGIKGAIWGVIFGSFLYLIIQIPTLKNLGFKFNLKIKESLSYFKKIINLMIPRTLMLLANNAIYFEITIAASFLASGSLANYNLADSIQALPQTIIALSFITVAFPTLSNFWAKYQKEESQEEKDIHLKDFEKVVKDTTYNILTIIIPISLLLIVFSRGIVSLLFGYGNFLESDQIITANLLAIFAVFLPIQALILFLIRVFFSLADSKTPFISLLISLVFSIPLVWFLSKAIGVYGIALGVGIGALINVIFLINYLQRKINLDLKNILKISLKSYALGLISCLIGYIVYYLLNLIIVNSGFIFLLVKLSIAIGIAIGIFILFDKKSILQILNQSLKKLIFKNGDKKH